MVAGWTLPLPCIFCSSPDNLTDEHVFPAFMGGELEVKDGSCMQCNREFGLAEAQLKEPITPLLNLLQISNRYDVVPNSQLQANIRGLDLKNPPAFMNGKGKIILSDFVRTSVGEDGRLVHQGFFLTRETGKRFAQRGRAKGLRVIEREVPTEIVIEATYTVTLPFAFSLSARKVAAKIALAAIAHELGCGFALTPQFDFLRKARNASQPPRDLRVWIFANEGFMSAQLRNAHQHSVTCYLSAGRKQGWALVALFGGISYLVEVTRAYSESTDRNFNITYDAAAKQRINPIVLADEMTLIGHVLSPATKFEDREAIYDQWHPIISEFCAQKGMIVERLGEIRDAGG
jgi:hypothetical protein